MFENVESGVVLQGSRNEWEENGEVRVEVGMRLLGRFMSRLL